MNVSLTELRLYGEALPDLITSLIHKRTKKSLLMAETLATFISSIDMVIEEHNARMLYEESLSTIMERVAPGKDWAHPHQVIDAVEEYTMKKHRER